MSTRCRPAWPPSPMSPCCARRATRASAASCRSRAVAAIDPQAVLALATSWNADLTVVGPEAPLAAGVADLFLSAARPLFGPTRAAAQLETSKAFAKEVMARAAVPTARALICDSPGAALAAVRSGALGLPVVVKADGLAGGKGVVIAADAAAAEAAVRAAMVDGAFGAAGARVVLEECLVGEELSYFVIADGERFVTCGSAQDHKRLLDGDQRAEHRRYGRVRSQRAGDRRALGADRTRDRAADAVGDEGGGHAVSRLSLLRLDAHGRRPQGHRVQLPLRRPRGTGRVAAARRAAVGAAPGSEHRGAAAVARQVLD